MPTISKLLESDLEWREEELSTLKILAFTSDVDSVRRRAVLRALTALLYAHYEGFCKYAWEIYLKYIQDQNIILADLKKPLVIHSLKQHFSRVKKISNNEDIFKVLTIEFPIYLSLPPIFSEYLETKSNLWPELFIENMTIACLPIDKILNYRSFIKTLVYRRNEIAHGKQLEIKNIDDYNLIEHAVTEVMYGLAIDIIDVCATNSFID